MVSAEGSASTHYVREESRPSWSPLASPLPVPILAAIPSMTTDDAVITTSAGFTAPIIQRGSRRLAAGGLDRTRSLRRVASEADLSESTGPTEEYRFSEPNLADIPLTVDAARSRHTSRDFTFARGISPPPLASPPPGYSSPTMDTFATALSNTETDYRTPQSANISLAATALPFSLTQSVHTAQPFTPMGTAHQYSTAPSFHTARGSSPMITARDLSSSASAHTTLASIATSTAQPSTTMYTAPSMAETTQSHAPDEKIAVPTVAITGPSPGSSAGTLTARTGCVGTSSALSSMMTALSSPSHYDTARDSVNSAALGGLMSPFETADERASRLSTYATNTASTYDTAPPPVPSRDSAYGTAPTGRSSSSSRGTSPQRFQLHDAPVPSSYITAPLTSEKSQYTTISSPDASYRTARPPTTRHSTETTVYQTVPAKSSSSYTTAPPPPISRSITEASGQLSWRSDAQEQAETATHVSEPDTDLGLLADLERQSSSGSTFSTRSARAIVPNQYDTVARWSTTTAGPTAYEKAPEGTLYETAMATIYTDAPSWHTQSTYMTTARGTQE